MGICILNKVFLLPTNASLDALRDVMATCPILINWDSLGVEIGTTNADLVANPDVEYRALTSELNVWYETATGQSSLLLTLLPSPEMADRHNQIGDVWGRQDFFPFMKLYDDPVLQRNRRAFFNSVSSRFYDYPLMLTFHAEMVVESDAIVPAQEDFYADYAKRSAQGTLQKFVG